MRYRLLGFSSFIAFAYDQEDFLPPNLISYFNNQFVNFRFI